jgi:hypothetical protein
MPAFVRVIGALAVFVSVPALAAEGVPISVRANERLPVVLVSSSAAFDRACPRYYRQGNDPDVMTSIADEFCTCIAGNMDAQGLGSEVMDFLARTYSEDLTTFIDDYPNGQAWMDAFFAAEQQCKNNTDYGSNQPPADAGESGGFPIEAGSWGGIVRSGPGQEFSKLATLAEGERITLIENTGVWANDYPWFRIEYRGSRRGYQWGGIICSVGNQVDGTYETCP